MTDRSDDTAAPRREIPAKPGATVDLRDAPRTDVPGPDRAAAQAAKPAIESSVVGAGGGPAAMTPRSAAQTGAPLRMGMPAVSAREADAPKPETQKPQVEKARMQDKPVPAPEATPTPALATSPAGKPAPERVVEVRRGGLGGMVLGGLIAAGLGAGATYWAIPRLPAAWQPGSGMNNAALTDAASQAATTAARAEIAQLTTELETRARAAAETAARSAAEANLAAQGEGLLTQARAAGADAAAKLIAEAPATPQPDGAIQTTLAAQAQQLAALDEAVNALRTAPAATAGSPVDLGPLEQQLAQLATRIEELAARPTLGPAEAQRLESLAADADAATARIRSAADEAEARLKDAEARTAELTSAADEAARRARAAAATAALGEAIQTGQPRAAALAELEQAGIAAPAALTAEIPTLDQLAADFPPAARAAVRAALRAESAAGEGSVVGNFLRAQTGARSVAPRDGSDADAVLSRAGDHVAHGRIEGALGELTALPDAARPAMESWIASARSYADAQAALAGLNNPAEAKAAPATAAPGAEAPSAETSAPSDAKPATEPNGAPAGAAAPTEAPTDTPTDAASQAAPATSASTPTPAAAPAPAPAAAPAN